MEFLKILELNGNKIMSIIISIIYLYFFYNTFFILFSDKFTNLSPAFITSLVIISFICLGVLTTLLIEYTFKFLIYILKTANKNNRLNIYKEINNYNTKRRKNILLNQGVYLYNFMKETLTWYNDQMLEYKAKLLELYLLPIRVDKFQREFYKDQDKKDKNRKNIFNFFFRKRISDDYLNIQVLSNSTIIKIDPYLLKILEKEYMNKDNY